MIDILLNAKSFLKELAEFSSGQKAKEMLIKS